MANTILKFLSLLMMAFLLSGVAKADVFPDGTAYQVCFTPGDNCQQLIVDTINSAKQSIYVQAYTFTSSAIKKALVDAKNKGIDVNVILDKSQYKKSPTALYFQNALVPTWIDAIPDIAHNKVMIIDHQIVITGSFNFTTAAQNSHTENVLIINDPALASKYYDNWMSREKVSTPVQDYHP